MTNECHTLEEKSKYLKIGMYELCDACTSVLIRCHQISFLPIISQYYLLKALSIDSAAVNVSYILLNLD